MRSSFEISMSRDIRDAMCHDVPSPSDHFPVFVNFMLKVGETVDGVAIERVSTEAPSDLQDGYEKHRECARLENFMAWNKL